MHRSLKSSLTIAALTSFIAITTMTPGHAATGNSATGAAEVRGIVTSVTGQRAAGVPVDLYAFPAASVMSHLRPGENVPWKLAGSAITTASGTYAIQVTGLSTLRPMASPGGIVNFEVHSMASNGVGAFSFSRRLASTHSGLTLEDTAAQAGAVDIRLVKTPHTLQQVNKKERCGTTYLSSYGPKNTVVGTTYAHTNGVSATFVYTNGQSSSLGVGFSVSGNSGTWSQNGTWSMSSSATETYPTYNGPSSWKYETYFVQGKYDYWCSSQGILNYFTQQTAYADGATTARMSAIPGAAYCAPYGAGTSARVTWSKSQTLSVGFVISAIGWGGSAQTGYDTSGADLFKFSANHHLCGTTGYPGTAPGQLVEAS